MLYSDYTRKMTKVAVAVSVVKKYKILIISIIAAVLAVTAALLGTRGLVYDSSDCPTSIEYGSEFTYRAGAFLGNVDYEFCAAGSAEWTDTPPIRVGKYYVRAVSSRTGGAKSYGTVHEFEIVPKKTEITIADSVVYGDKPEYSAVLAYDDTLVCDKFEYADITKTSTEVRADLEHARVIDVNGEDVSSSYDLVSRYALIVFTPREIEITVPDAVREYDGLPFSSSEYEITNGTLADGDVIIASFDKTQTSVGSVDNEPVIGIKRTVLNGDGKNVTANYKIKQTVGLLTVTKREVVVKTRDASHVYDGQPFGCTEFDIAEGYSLAAGDVLVPTLFDTIVDAGKKENYVYYRVHNADGEDISDNYSLTIDAGLLTVEKRDVTLITGSSQKTYDGMPLVYTDHELVGAVDGHKFDVSESTSIIDVQSAENVLKGSVVTADGKDDKTDNYNITWQYGTLTVNKRDVTVRTSTARWTYDGNIHSASGNFVFENLVRGHSLNVLEYITVENVLRDGDGNVVGADNAMVFGVVDGDGNDISDNYNITVECGTLTITPREIEVATATNSWVYDGKEHSDNGLRRTFGTLADGQEFAVNGVTIVKDATVDDGGDISPIRNVLDFEIVSSADGEVLTDNYEISVINGTLTVTRRVIGLCPNGAKKEYDGTPLTNDGLGWSVIKLMNPAAELQGFAEGHTVTRYGVIRASVTDVGKADTRFVESNTVISDGDGVDVTANYNISFFGTVLEVTPRKILIDSGSLKYFHYDGRAHGLDTCFDVDKKLLSDLGHKIVVIENTEVTDVVRNDDGDVIGVENVIKAVIENGDGSVNDNYEITYKFGTITIFPRELKFETASNYWEYDGDEHRDDGFTLVSGDTEYGKIVEGQSAVVYYSPGITDAGVLPNDLEIRIVRDATRGDIWADNNNATHNYDISCKVGTLAIGPRRIDVVTDSNTWLYDGDEHYQDSWKITYGSLVTGHSLRSTKYTVITDVSRDENYGVVGVENDIALEIVGTKPDNYKITVVEFGTLTVTPVKITVKALDSEIYYGTRWSKGSCSIRAGALIAGHEGVPSFAYEDGDTLVNVDFSGFDYLPVGTYRYNIAPFTVWAGNVEKTHNYDVSYGDFATMIVKKIVMTFELSDEEYIYDGTEHAPTGTPILATGSMSAAEKETVTWTFTPESARTDVGKSVITAIPAVTHDHGGKVYDATDNYDIAVNTATLSVLPRPVLVRADTVEKMYDDTPLTAGASIVATRYIGGEWDGKIFYSLVPGHGLEYKMSSESVITYVGSVVNSVVRGSVVLTDGNNVDVTHNYDIYYEDGTLTVTKRPIAVCGGTAFKVYDGEPLTCAGLVDDTVGGYGLVFGHTADIVCTGSITDVGSVNNPVDAERSFIYDKNGKDVTRNYEFILFDGTLIVYKRPLYAQTDTRIKVYDGTPLYGGGIKIENSDDVSGLVSGHSAYIDPVLPSITDYTEDEFGVPGVENAVIIGMITDADGREVIDNYDIIYDYGMLEIIRRRITVKTATNEWEYDGALHFDDRFELVDGTLVAALEHELAINYYTTISDPGAVDNYIEFSVIGVCNDSLHEHERCVYTHNYQIELEMGTLTITMPDVPDPPEPPGPPAELRDLVNVTAARDGEVYLRLESYGDYNGTTDWNVGNDYTGQAVNYNGKNYSVNNLTSIALQKAGFKAYGTEIEVLFTYQFMSVLPYYTTLASSPVYDSDIRYTGKDTVYSVEQYYYSYTDDDGAALSSVELDITQAAVERAYREYVYENYLAVPADTAAYLREFIAENNLYADDSAIVGKVAKAIKRSATYSLEYDTAVDTSGDVVVSFLRDYKQGVCRHYASAATLVYRTLGIPARYTVGILAETKAGEKVTTKEDRAHAWVEVYIDGIGWVQVEVTGSFDGSGGGSGNGNQSGDGDNPGDGNGDGNGKTKISIQPIDTVFEYTGEELFADQIVFTPDGASSVTIDDLTALGYRYTVTIAGSRIDVGETVTEITEFKLYDKTGKDVTDEFFVVKLAGSLLVTKQQIWMRVPGLSKEYDGTPLVFEELLPDIMPGYYWYEAVSLPDGVTRVEIDMAAIPGITDVGSLTGNKLSSLLEQLGICTVYGIDGDDVTENFTILIAEGGLTVTPRELVIVAGSSSKVYDGEELTCDTYSMLHGTLAEGHRLEVVTDGAIIDVGHDVNIIRKWSVYDGDGNDVSDNYSVERLPGLLTVM